MSVDEIMEALKSIIDGAEGRDLTDEEVERYETLEGQLTTVQRSEDIRARQRAYMTPVPGSVIHVATPKADDTLNRAFDHYLRTGQQNQDIVELRAQGEVDGSSGGYLVPDDFRAKVVDRMKAFSGLANVCEEITTANGAPLAWPTLDDTSNLGEIVSEGGTFAAGADLNFGAASLGAYRYMAGGAGATPLRLSVELLADASFDVGALVANKLGTRIARLQAQHLVTGTGVSQPKGLTTGITGTQLTTTGVLAYADLINFIHAVDPAYRDGSKWAFNDKTLGIVQKMADSQNRPLWQPYMSDMSISPGAGTLLGYPVVIDQAFPDAGLTGTTVNWGAFGNFTEGYIIRRVQDVTLIVNPWTRAANGQVEYTAWARMDATQQNTNAYICMTGK